MTKAEIQAVLFVAVSMLAGACVLLVKQYDADFLPDLGPVPADTRPDAGVRPGSAPAAGIAMAGTDRPGWASAAGVRPGPASAARIGMAGTDRDGAGRPSKPSEPSEPTEPSGQLLVPVNTAPASELQKLPGIGPKLAEAIIAYRKQSGPFASVEQLLEVKGIGPAKLRRLGPFVELK